MLVLLGFQHRQEHRQENVTGEGVDSDTQNYLPHISVFRRSLYLGKKKM